jgi:hypothetical protein
LKTDSKTARNVAKIKSKVKVLEGKLTKYCSLIFLADIKLGESKG